MCTVCFSSAKSVVFFFEKLCFFCCFFSCKLEWEDCSRAVLSAPVVNQEKSLYFCGKEEHSLFCQTLSLFRLGSQFAARYQTHQQPWPKLKAAKNMDQGWLKSHLILFEWFCALFCEQWLEYNSAVVVSWFCNCRHLTLLLQRLSWPP